MSWSGLKKAINRAGTHVMMKTGQVEASVDLEYEFEEKRYKMMEDKCHKLQRELKQYLNTLKLITGAQQNVSEVLSSYFGQPEVHSLTDDTPHANKHIAHEYYAVMKRLNSNTIGELEQPYYQTVINPVARFNSYFVEVNEAIKKRAHKQLDYDALKSKVSKLLDHPPSPAAYSEDDPHKHDRDHQQHVAYEKKLEESQAQLSEAEAVYDTLNNQLKQELPRLINLRIPFLDPSFELFVRLQMLFFNQNYSQLNELQRTIDTKTRQDYVEGKLEGRIDDVLGRMRELNITGA
jgi:hypothetical protein